jgi:hypothetical protein
VNVGLQRVAVALLIPCASLLWAAPCRAQSEEPSGARPAPPPAAEHSGTAVNCYGEHRAAWALHELFVALTNPVGAESQLQVSRCWPLVTDGGPLFDLTNVETGAFLYLSPSYTHQGLFASVAPLSILVFRLEVAGIYVWPLPLPGGSYFALDGYDESFASDGISHDVDAAPGDAGGLNIAFSTTVQASVTLAELGAGRLELLVSDSLGLEYWLMGSGGYYYNLRKDAILARSDLVLTNCGALLLSIPLRSGLGMRIGAVDMLLYGVGSQRVETNQVGGIVAIYIERSRDVRGIQPFVQVLGYTNQESRRLTFPLDVMIGIDLAAVLD